MYILSLAIVLIVVVVVVVVVGTFVETVVNNICKTMTFKCGEYQAIIISFSFNANNNNDNNNNRIKTRKVLKEYRYSAVHGQHPFQCLS